MERTVQCHICKEPYKFYAFSAADQTACPRCVRKAEMNRDRSPVSVLQHNAEVGGYELDSEVVSRLREYCDETVDVED